MKTIAADLPAIVFMKVGRHAGEDFDAIIERKMNEFKQAGMIFWGYGGGTMHPIQRVQPFARMMIERGAGLTLVMQPIVSHHPDTTVVATEYSKDGIHWEPIPGGIAVRGSRYALVLGEIRPGDLEVDLLQYRVGAGPSAGRIASDYVQGRVDKACLERVEAPPDGTGANIIKVTYTAPLKEPYAVLLKGHASG
jgi:hypothetical protein